MKKPEVNYRLEDLLCDDGFCRLARQGDFSPEETVDLIRRDYPASESVIRDAVLLLKAVRIETESIPPEQIEEQLDRLKTSIRQKRRRKKLVVSLGITTAAVAAAAALFVTLIVPRKENERLSEMLDYIASAEIGGDSVRLAVGTEPDRSVADNASIVIRQDGSLTVTQGDKMEIARSGTPAELIRLSVPYGKRSHLELPDGSRIWVNSGTRLVYPGTFGERRREIVVSGEVYMEVAPDKRPFHVRTEQMDIRVLGTEFNVTAYPDDRQQRVALLRGSVEITVPDQGKHLLAPGELLSLDGDGSVRTGKDDLTYYTGWRDGYLKLNGDTLDDVFKRLGRYYNREFLYTEDFGNTRFRGKFDLGETWEEALNNLSLTLPLGFYADTEDRVYVRFK